MKICYLGCKVKYCNCKRISKLNLHTSYWENRAVTSDEINIINYLFKNKNLIIDKTILHIGIGNLELAKKISKFTKNFEGISISSNEISHGNNLFNNKIKFYLCDKYSKKFNKIMKKSYDVIIDNNIKSYSCCDLAFENLFKLLNSKLKKKGVIITSLNGLKWTKLLKRKLAFNFKSFFYYKFKEIDGPNRNILNIHKCKSLSEKYNMYFFTNNNIVFFKK